MGIYEVSVGMFESLSDYKALVFDYSVMFEVGGTPIFDELLDVIMKSGLDVYVSKTFKMLHYCVLRQADPKSKRAVDSMKTFCSYLLPDKKLHLVNELETGAFLEAFASVEGACILTTRNGIFTKRLYEKHPDFSGHVAILTGRELKIFESVDKLTEDYPLPEVSKLALNNSYLDEYAFASVGDVVKSKEQRESYELIKRLSGGAEGMVFTTDNKNLVAKIYHRGTITPLRWAKLQKLADLGIRSNGFCLPRTLLYFNNIPVGYTMPLGQGTTLGSVFDGPDAILEQFPDWTRLDVVETLVSLIEKYLYLHLHNVVAGDIQLKNALIASPKKVFLIDMDSVQAGNLPCPVGTEEFTDPRLWGKDFAGFVRGLCDEDYSIAMLVFSILFCGLHPYATRKGAETLKEEIIEKNFPYTLDNSDEEHIPVGGYNHIWRRLPERLRKMLYQTFKCGTRYEAVQWYDAVSAYRDDIIAMKLDDAEAYKLFPDSDYNQKEYTGLADDFKPEEHKAAESASAPAPAPSPFAQQAPAEPKPAFAPVADGSAFQNPEPKPVFEKKTFAAPSGKYVPRNIADPEAAKNYGAHKDEPEQNKKKGGKFFGLL